MSKNPKGDCRSGTRLYRIWSNMKDRCYRPSNEYFSRYGGRGISVCEEWKENFYSFEEWAYSHGYREYLTIDRIDNNGNYCPENCRWTTQSVQMRNMSKSIFLTIDGVTRNVNEWAETTGLPVDVIRNRHLKGDTGQDLIRPRYQVVNPATPKYEINGISKSAKEWAQEIGISESGFNYRWRNGKRGDEILKPNRVKKPRNNA